MEDFDGISRGVDTLKCLSLDAKNDIKAFLQHFSGKKLLTDNTLNQTVNQISFKVMKEFSIDLNKHKKDKLDTVSLLLKQFEVCARMHRKTMSESSYYLCLCLISSFYTTKSMVHLLLAGVKVAMEDSLKAFEVNPLNSVDNLHTPLNSVKLWHGLKYPMRAHFGNLSRLGQNSGENCLEYLKVYMKTLQAWKTHYSPEVDEFVEVMYDLAILITLSKGKLTDITVPKTVFELPLSGRKAIFTRENVHCIVSESLRALKDVPFNNVWEAIVMGLFIDEKYKAVAMLVQGTYGEPEATDTPLHGYAKDLISSIDVDVGQMLKSVCMICDNKFLTMLDKCQIEAWHLSLAEYLIERGGQVDTVERHFNETPMCVISRLAIETGSIGFLRAALAKIPPMRLDEATLPGGDTALHIVASITTCETRWIYGKEMCQLLLDKGCVPTIRNNAKQLPLAIIEAKPYLSPHRALLKEHMDKPGPGLVQRVDQLKQQGNTLMKKQQYQTAIDIYRVAVSVAQHYPNNLSTVLSLLYSNIAATYKCQKKYREALQAAKQSQKFDNKFWKAYWHQGTCQLELNHPKEAFVSFLQGCRNMDSEELQFKFVQELVKLYDAVPSSQFITIKDLLKLHWGRTLNWMSLNRMWTLICRFVMGSTDHHAITTDGIVQHYTEYDKVNHWDMSTAQLHTYFNENMDPITVVMGTASIATMVGQSHIDMTFPLLSHLLMHGAKPETLVDSQGKNAGGRAETHFHTATRLSFGKRNENIILQVLMMKSQTDVKVALDEELQTPLHTLCQLVGQNPSNAKDPYSVKVACALLQRGVSLTSKDVYMQEASELVPSSTPLGKFLAAEKEKINKKDSGCQVWEKHKADGNAAFKKGEFQQAALHYHNAICSIDDFVDCNIGTNSHNLAILYGNMSECMAKLTDWGQMCVFASLSVKNDPKWYKGHLRHARGSIKLKDLDTATDDYIKCFHCALKKKESIQVQVEVLKEIAQFLFLQKLQKNDLMKPWKMLVDLGRSAINLLPHVIFILVSQADKDSLEEPNKDMMMAHLILLQFAKQFDWSKGLQQIGDCSYMNLNLLDRGPPLYRQRWVSGFLLELYTECGADIRSLSTGHKQNKKVLEKVPELKQHASELGFIIDSMGTAGEVPFYHTLVKMQRDCYLEVDDTDTAELKGSYDFDMDWMAKIFETYVEPYGQENARDGEGNTVLHLLVSMLEKRTKRVCKPLIEYLFSKDKDPLTNFSGKTIFECAKESCDPDISAFLKSLEIESDKKYHNFLENLGTSNKGKKKQTSEGYQKKVNKATKKNWETMKSKVPSDSAIIQSWCTDGHVADMKKLFKKELNDLYSPQTTDASKPSPNPVMYRTTDFSQANKMDKMMRDVMAKSGLKADAGERQGFKEMRKQFPDYFNMDKEDCDSVKKQSSSKKSKKPEKENIPCASTKPKPQMTNVPKTTNVPETEKVVDVNDIDEDDSVRVRSDKKPAISGLPAPGMYDGWWDSDEDDADSGHSGGGAQAQAKPLKVKGQQNAHQKKKKR